MRRRRFVWWRAAGLGTLACAVACALAVAGCGGGVRKHHRRRPSGPPAPTVVDVYSSLPLPAADSTVDAIRLALSQAHGRAGGFLVHYISLSDSSGGSAVWNDVQTAAEARRAAVDPKAILYIGDLASGATEISAPILNEAGIPQITPGSPYVGLTENVPRVTAPGEPKEYFPSGSRTLLRIVPNDEVEVAAALQALRLDGCGRIAAAHDDGSVGVTLASLLAREGPQLRMNISSSTEITPRISLSTYATTIRNQGAECLMLMGTNAPEAVSVARAVHLVLPTIPILGTTGICNRSWADPADGGLPLSFDPVLQCVSSALPTSGWPGGARFLAAYRAAYHGAEPAPTAIFGYEAMTLGLNTIASLGGAGDSRAALVRALFAIRSTQSVLGVYGFDADGDTTLRTYGLFRVTNGALTLDRAPLKVP